MASEPSEWALSRLRNGWTTVTGRDAAFVSEKGTARLLDAARLEGVRIGLEAAYRLSRGVASRLSGPHRDGAIEAITEIRCADPEAVLRKHEERGDA